MDPTLPCPKCRTVIPATASICPRCSLPLTTETSGASRILDASIKTSADTHTHQHTHYHGDRPQPPLPPVVPPPVTHSPHFQSGKRSVLVLVPLSAVVAVLITVKMMSGDKKAPEPPTPVSPVIVTINNIDENELTGDKQPNPTPPKTPESAGSAAALPLPPSVLTPPPPPPAQPIAVRLQLDRTEYTEGDFMSLKVEAPSDGYLYVLAIWADGQITTLFPNGVRPNPQVAKGETLQLPSDMPPLQTGERLHYRMEMPDLPGAPSFAQESIIAFHSPILLTLPRGSADFGPFFSSLGILRDPELRSRGPRPQFLRLQSGDEFSFAKLPQAAVHYRIIPHPLRQAVGKWRIQESVQPSHGGHQILWASTAAFTPPGDLPATLSITGTKTRVDGKTPTPGERQAKHVIAITHQNSSYAATYDEINHRGELLQRNLSIHFAPDFRSFSADLLNGSELESKLTGTLP